MSTKIRLTYYGLEGEGATVREAKAQAGERIEALVRAVNDGPALVVCGAWAAMVCPRVDGWGYMILTDDTGAIRKLPSGMTSGFEGRDEAIVYAAQHMTDNAWSTAVAVEDDAAFAREMLAPYIAKRDLERAIADKVERFAWQRRARAALDAGYSNGEAHDMACRGVMVGGGA